MMIIGYLPSWRHLGRDLGHLNWRPFKWGTFFREDLVMHIVFLQIGACLEGTHPRRPRGSQSGREKRRYKSF